MWTRRELKEQAKDALKRNYWKAVLVTVLFGALLGGTGGAATAGVAASSGSGSGDTGSAWTFIGGFLHEYFPGLLTTLIILAVVLVILSLAVSILLLNPINVGFSYFRVNALRGTAMWATWAAASMPPISATWAPCCCRRCIPSCGPAC